MSHRVLLFVYANTGGGHKASALAVAREVAAREGDCEVVLYDPTDIPFLRHPVRRTLRGYGLLVRHVPFIWAAIYGTSNRRVGFHFLRNVAKHTYTKSIAAEIDRVRPDVVVGFHGYIASAIKTAAKDKPSALVVTDLENVHRYWLNEPFDRIIVPTERVRSQAITMGADADRIRVTGLPVAAGFASAPRSENALACLRAKLGLKQMFTVLIAGGGEGFGNLSQQAAALAQTFGRVQIVVVCGHNKRALTETTQLAARYPNVKAFGFVDNMDELLQASDVFATKAGPGAIQEAANAGVPVVLTGAIPGQEAQNYQCVVSAGAGSSVNNLKELASAIGALHWNKQLLQERRDNMARLSSPRAAAAIAEEVCTLLPYRTKQTRRISRPGRIAAMALVAVIIGAVGFAEADTAAALRAPALSASKDVTSDFVEAGYRHIHHSRP